MAARVPPPRPPRSPLDPTGTLASPTKDSPKGLTESETSAKSCIEADCSFSRGNDRSGAPPEVLPRAGGGSTSKSRDLGKEQALPHFSFLFFFFEIFQKLSLNSRWFGTIRLAVLLLKASSFHQSPFQPQKPNSSPRKSTENSEGRRPAPKANPSPIPVPKSHPKASPTPKRENPEPEAGPNPNLKRKGPPNQPQNPARKTPNPTITPQ